MQHIDSDHRADGRCQVVTETVISYALSPAFAGQDVDCHGAGRNRGGSERSSVQCPEYSEHRERPGNEVPAEKREEDEVADDENHPTREVVDDIPAEGPDNQRHDRVAGKAQADGLLVRPESFGQIQRKQRNDERE